jgi:hypothetical protein
MICVNISQSNGFRNRLGQTELSERLPSSNQRLHDYSYKCTPYIRMTVNANLLRRV